ncbi:regulator [Devosia insulae DS-56]|uniref:Regulator n=1 Tax=Devosia insulae DS-56 TaxID=1116389 RepID=A0A1E5XHL6_9HYPH|nr:response regulator [Devosia insulae]OEO28100.1 regulator [Devosia insulae DS-56]
MGKTKSVVAIVDDDAPLLESLENMFESAGYVVRCFSSAAELLSDGRLMDVDVVVTDVGMPAMDGFELCDRVRKMRPRLPVFLITARHEIVDRRRPQAPGGFFRKPFDARELIAAVREALHRASKEDDRED